MNDLERHVLRLIGENVTSPDVFTDSTAGLTQIRDSLNDAIQELCMVSGAYRRPYPLSLVADRQWYHLNPQHDYVVYVYSAWDAGRQYRLEPMGIWEACETAGDWADQTGPAERFVRVGFDMIGVVYIPTETGRVLELDCVCVPKPYTDSTYPIRLRNNCERAAVYRAVAEFFASRGDAKRALEYDERYYDVAQIMMLSPKYHEQYYYPKMDREWQSQQIGR